MALAEQVHPFDAALARAHWEGKLPHGRSLPDGMPWAGDIFILENEDGTDTFCTWWGCWDFGPTLKRPPRHD